MSLNVMRCRKHYWIVLMPGGEPLEETLRATRREAMNAATELDDPEAWQELKYQGFRAVKVTLNLTD